MIPSSKNFFEVSDCQNCHPGINVTSTSNLYSFSIVKFLIQTLTQEVVSVVTEIHEIDCCGKAILKTLVEISYKKVSDARIQVKGISFRSYFRKVKLSIETLTEKIKLIVTKKHELECHHEAVLTSLSKVFGKSKI